MAELSYPDPPLQTGSVKLRPWRDSDVAAIVRACSDPGVAEFLVSLPSPYTNADARTWLATQESRRSAGTSLELAIAHADTNEVLGSLAARVDQRMQSAALGYWLSPQAQGHGYMTVAVQLLCGWLFEVVEVGRIELTTDPANLASQRVAQRCGFQREGLLRSHVMHLGTRERRDSVMWSLLPDDLAVPGDGDAAGPTGPRPQRTGR